MPAAQQFWCLGAKLHHPSLDALPRPPAEGGELFGFRYLPYGDQLSGTSPHFHVVGFDRECNKFLAAEGFYAIEQPCVDIVCDIGREQFESITLFKGTPAEVYNQFAWMSYDWNKLLISRWNYVYLGPKATRGVIPITRPAEINSAYTGTYGR